MTPYSNQFQPTNAPAPVDAGRSLYRILDTSLPGITSFGMRRPGIPWPPSGEGPRSLPPREGGAPSDGSALGQRQHLASRLASSEAFEFRLGEIDGLLGRFALLRAYGDHFANR